MSHEDEPPSYWLANCFLFPIWSIATSLAIGTARSAASERFMPSSHNLIEMASGNLSNHFERTSTVISWAMIDMTLG